MVSLTIGILITKDTALASLLLQSLVWEQPMESLILAQM